MQARIPAARLALSIRGIALMLLAGVIVTLTLDSESRAGVAPVTATAYCILGGGDGVSWTWTIKSSFPDLTGAPAGVVGTPGDVRDLFVTSIEAARTAAAQSYPTASAISPPSNCTGTPVAAFQIETVGAHTLFVEPVGGGAEVPVIGPDITAAVDFNPKIWIPMPEPGGAVSLISGVVVLAGLSRPRRRR